MQLPGQVWSLSCSPPPHPSPLLFFSLCLPSPLCFIPPTPLLGVSWLMI